MKEGLCAVELDNPGGSGGQVAEIQLHEYVKQVPFGSPPEQSSKSLDVLPSKFTVAL